MFERYTEQGRRSIFFARYEASQFGSPVIDAGHLLLGLLRESPLLKSSLPEAAIEDIRERVGAGCQGREKTSTSVDLPLSDDCKRALFLGAEESGALGHSVIDCGHLVLGLLRLGQPNSIADILGSHGVYYPSFREVVRESTLAAGAVSVSFTPERQRASEREREWDEPDPLKASAPSLQAIVIALDQLVQRIAKHVDLYSEAYGMHRLKRKPWTRMEAMGHLLDWATAHHQWFVRAMTEARLVASGYPQEDWVTIENYRDFSWRDIVDTWVGLNRLLVHVLTQVPEDKLTTSCRIGIAEPIPLLKLAQDYVAHCDDIVGQVLARL
jgi:Clp amino terminal domain, pathogenicity island component